MGQNTTKLLTLKSGRKLNVILSSAFQKKETSQGAVICLSGFGCDHYNFSWIERELSQSDTYGNQFPLVMIDNRGMGESSQATEDYEIKDLALDALECAEQLELEEFHVAGISMGGFIAQELTLLAQDKIKSLSLLCTSSGGSEFIDLPLTTEEGLRAFYALEEPLKSTSAVKATVHESLEQENRELFNDIVQLRRDHPVDGEQAIKQKHAVDRFLAQSFPLSEIRVPTLIMTGADDRYVNPENSKILNQKIKNSKLISIPKGDHLFFLEKSEEVTLELGKFWSEV